MGNSRERKRYEKLIRSTKNKGGFLSIEDSLVTKQSPRKMTDDCINQVKYEKNITKVKSAIIYLQAGRVERALDSLLERLEVEQELQIRTSIIQAVGFIKAQPKRVIPILEEIMLKDPNNKVRQAVPQALTNFGDKAKKVLYNALYRAKGEVRYQIIMALIELEVDEEKLINTFRKEMAVATNPFDRYSYASGLIQLEGLESSGLKIINDLIESNKLSSEQIFTFHFLYVRTNDEKMRQIQAQQKFSEFINETTTTHETDQIEFKSTFTGGSSNPKIVQESKFRIARTIASFLNSKGGILFIGVSDDGEIIGLESDFKILKGDNKKDAFGQELAQTINKHLGTIYHHLIDVKFGKYFAYEICMVRIKASHELVPITDIKGQKHYVIRTINRTYTLKSHEIDKYNDIRRQNPSNIDSSST